MSVTPSSVVIIPFGKWSSFDDCVQDIVKTQGKDEESAKRICGALQARLGRESFDWTGDLKPFGKNLIRGKALHPIKTVHPEEWPSVRVYLEEELEKAAHTLAGTPLLLDHMVELPAPNRVLDAEYEDGAVEYVAEVSDEVLQKIHDGLIKHVSVEFDWRSLEKLNGVAPHDITFTGLSLLERFAPGDPLSTVEVWEGVISRLKGAKTSEQAEPEEFIYYGVRDPIAFLQEHFSTTWIDKVNGIQAINARLRENPEVLHPVALLFMKANGWTLETVRGWLKDHPQYWRGPETVPPAVGVQPAQALESKLLEQQTPDPGQEKQPPAPTEKPPAAEKPLGEGVVDPAALPPQSPEDMIPKSEILALLPERIPRHWGYGPFELVRRIKRKVQA